MPTHRASSNLERRLNRHLRWGVASVAVVVVLAVLIAFIVALVLTSPW